MKKKICANCKYNCNYIVDGNVLCKFNGPVTPEYVCPKFVISPAGEWGNMIIVKGNKKCKDCVHFQYIPMQATGSDAEIVDTWGTCSIYTVREYDGAVKNACSRISLIS
jgi:hypothetical protein